MNFRTHYLLLGAGFAALLFITHAAGAQNLRLDSFALYGALHALCVTLALEGPLSAPRRAFVVVLAAAANVLVMYLGFGVLGLLAGLPSRGALFGALGVAAFFGALLYGSLLRGLLFPRLPPRRIVHIAVLCLAASLLTASAGLLRASTDLSWLVAAWWLAFSSGLWFVQRRFHVLGPQAHA